MAEKVLVPEMGESVLEATVASWFKKEGDYVHIGDVLLELETDKVNLEVGAPTAGVLAKIMVPAGEDVKVGDILGEIEPEAQPPEPQPESPAEEAAGQLAGQVRERPTGLQVTPVAARLASEKGVDVNALSGSGPEGRITRDDVEQYLQEQAKTGAARSQKPGQTEKPAESAAGAGLDQRREERLRMSRRRRTIAERLLEAQHTTAMLTTFNEIDMWAVMDLRRRRNEAFLGRHEVKLGITSFFVKAAVSALKAFPRVNAEIQGDEMILKHYYDLGIAIGAEEGLVVPVLRAADRLSFAEIEAQIKDFVARSEAGKLSIDDLRGGTFSITNGGVFGSLLSTPILNPPQVGILGLHKIEDRPVARDGQVLIRPMMYVALSYDHRIVDGREAVQFLVHIKDLVEDPEKMLLEG